MVITGSAATQTFKQIDLTRRRSIWAAKEPDGRPVSYLAIDSRKQDSCLNSVAYLHPVTV